MGKLALVTPITGMFLQVCLAVLLVRRRIWSLFPMFLAYVVFSLAASIAKLCVYSGSTLALNPHHPMNDIVGVNTRAFELAAAGACQVADFKEDLTTLFKPGEEVLTYRDVGELKRLLDHYLQRPDEARAIGANARRRALAEHTLRHRVEAMLAVIQDRFGK